MPVDKKQVIELRFATFSASTRDALKKLSATELSRLADEISDHNQEWLKIGGTLPKPIGI
jgi:hypothetical protein